MTDVDGLTATGSPGTVTGLEMLQAWAMGERPMPPHAADLGLSVRSASFGSVVFRWQPSTELAHTAGAVRGGYVSLVCDEAAALAAASLGLRFRPMRTLDLHTLLLRQVMPDTGYTVRAQVSYSGASRIVAEASVEDPEGLLVARATGSFVALATGRDEDAPAAAAPEPAEKDHPRTEPPPRTDDTAPAADATPVAPPATRAPETAPAPSTALPTRQDGTTDAGTGHNDPGDPRPDGHATGGDLRPVARLHYEPISDADRPVNDDMDLWQPASARRQSPSGAEGGTARPAGPDVERGPRRFLGRAEAWRRPAPEPEDAPQTRPKPPVVPALDGLPVADGLSPIDGLQGWEGLDGPTSDGTDLLRQYDRPRHARNLGTGRSAPPDAAADSGAASGGAGSGEAHMPMVPTPKSVVRHGGRRATVEHLRPVDIGTRASEGTPPGSR